MYKQTRTRKKFISLSGVEHVPVATLINGLSGICHVVKDEDCYICFLYVDDSGFVPVTYIFPELHKVLASLPSPDVNNEEIE